MSNWLTDFLCGMVGRENNTPRFGALDGVALHVPVPVPSEALQLVKDMNGRLVRLDGAATHCLVRAGLGEAEILASPSLRLALQRARANGVIVVEPSWLEAVGSLPAHADWTSVAVEDHVSPCMAFIGAAPQPPPAQPSPAQPPPSRAQPTRPRATAGRAALVHSLGETFEFLRRTKPEQLEADLV